MKPNRRGFLGLMAASPIAAKSAADDLLAKQAGINLSNTLASGAAGAGGPSPDLTQQQIKLALSNPLTKKLYESLLFESERRVGFIDHDIAVHRSTSLAAKIVFQRQRNVSNLINAEQNGWIWNRTRDFLRKAAGLLA